MTRRALLALSILVCGLAAAVAFDRPRPEPAEAGQLLPGLGTISRLEIRAPNRAPLVLQRNQAGELVLPGLPTDAAAVQDLVSEITLLSSRRRVPASPEHGLDRPRLELRIVDDKGTHELLVGRNEPALGRTWVALRGATHHDLIDDWAARGLDRTAEDLRRRAPFPGGEFARARLQAGDRRIELAGRPPLVALPGGSALADHRKVAALGERLDELRAARFVPAVEGTAPALSVEVDGAALWIFGEARGGERWAASPIGAITLPAEAVAGLEKLVADPLSWVERALFSATAGAVREIDIRPASGRALHLERTAGAWLLEGKRADDVAVDDWLRELLAERAAGVSAAPPMRERPAGSDEIAVRGAAGPEVVWLSGGALRRPDEPVALAAPRAIERFFRADAVEFADRGVFSFEPSSVSEIRVGGERAVRGASLDDWQLTEPLSLAADGAIVDKLRDTMAALRARRAVAARARPEHGLDPPRRVLEVVLAPAPGQDRPERRVLELGGTTATGACHARRGGEQTVYLLAPDDCRALDVHLATREVFRAADVAGVAMPLDPDERKPLLASLARAPAVAGYGAMTGRELVLDTADGPLVLVFRGREYARKDRAVRYRVAAEVCEKWKALCQ